MEILQGVWEVFKDNIDTTNNKVTIFSEKCNEILR